MSYQVIARKYRPQTFEEVVGQRPIVTTLRNAVEQRRLHHAYLFSGPRGVGKTTVARLLAKAINCAQGPTAKPCNACASCAEITSSRSMDVLEIDGASNRGIENIRELRETVRYAPARDRHKVFIIDEVHMLTDPAWNALLKTLEEPPPQVVFVFATTEYRELPRTILSRCQHFEFRKVPPSELLSHLRHVAEGERVTVEPAALDLIARVADGSLRDALSALDQVIAFSGSAVTDEQARTILGAIDRDLVFDFYAAVREHDCARVVALVDTLFEKGYQPVDFLEDLLAHGRDLLLARTVAEPERFIAGTPEEIRALVARARVFTEDELLRLIEVITREEPRIRGSSHARFMLEALGIRMARLADLRPIEELLARLSGPAAALPAVPGQANPAGPAAGTPAGGFGPGTGGGTAPRSGGPAGERRSRDTDAAAPVAAAPPIAAPGLGFAAPASPIAEPAVAALQPVTGSDAPPTPEGLVETLVRRVGEERGAVGAMLEQAAWIQVTGDVLQVAFDEKHSFFRDKVQGREVADYLRRVARDLSGRDLRLQVLSGSVAALGVAAMDGRPSRDPAAIDRPAAPGARPASLAPAPRRVTDSVLTDRGGPADPPAPAGGPRASAPLRDDPRRSALLARALQEPALRSVIDLFGGEIVDIEPV